jgi:hypothetical protein
VPAPCGALPLYADALHLGNLVLGPLAAHLAYRAMRRMPGPASGPVVVANAAVVPAIVIAIVAALTALAGG